MSKPKGDYQKNFGLELVVIIQHEENIVSGKPDTDVLIFYHTCQNRKQS